MHLRYSLQEIAKGKSPNNEDWIINGRDTHYVDRLGKPLMPYTPKIREGVLRICLEANISSIAMKCAFPDWLGYLGFVLEHASTHSSLYKAVSDKWALQLKNMVSERSGSYLRLSEVANGHSMLTIHDLELIESDMMFQAARK